MANKNVDVSVNDEMEEVKLKEQVEQTLPSGVYKLSNGVLIRIDQAELATSEVAKNLMIGVFKTIKLDKNGQIKDTSDPVKSADSIIQLQDTLLSNFVTLYRTIEEELNNNSLLDKKWFNKLKRSPMLTQNLDLEDEDDINYLFLKYVAFSTQEDWALLIEKTIGKQ